MLQRTQFLKRILTLNRLNRIQLRCSSTGTTSDEVSHFESLASTWWDVNGSQAILHRMNLARLDFVQRIIRNSIALNEEPTKASQDDVYIPGYNYKAFFPKEVSNAVSQDIRMTASSKLQKMKLNVLDVGCGGGILSESMGRLPFIKHVTGIDLAPDCITVAKSHARSDPLLQGKVSYHVKSLENVKGKFDIVTCFEMLEHVDHPEAILNHAWKRLNKEGILFISTINKDLVSWFTTIFVAENILGIVPRGTHHLSKYVNSKDIVQWFQKNEGSKYELLDLKGTMFIPIKGWVEHDCPNVGNYIMAIRKE
ncbi:hexaprenyldihydroxybenzoate methyltransferase NDAI_0G04260 [Naumovozyma dairenensis CBS 421]|uniref:Ubiquinone biosynthesis O-methyltransferase, mitochondrial n=1 Tax=Naumovozyma dairenensis (strain ATCC 10597 / BCRC 20456 / CBS 421 / NBRC 0211 / NRRL Y-12639) TaxID=1071378 RepID=J7S4E6_NAUDC|nr:hypothetical protein NDAI_0G04260 [Naumovozyma dairenensis CBS 421]CCK73411.1 hypothetical protein NDAI_0G04260 [Naumovozyma dairenensis CBS 421]